MFTKDKIEQFLKGDLVISVPESQWNKIHPYIQKITNNKYWANAKTSTHGKVYWNITTHPLRKWYARKCDCRDMVKHYNELIEKDRLDEIEKLKQEILRLEKLK